MGMDIYGHDTGYLRRNIWSIGGVIALLEWAGALDSTLQYTTDPNTPDPTPVPGSYRLTDNSGWVVTKDQADEMARRLKAARAANPDMACLVLTTRDRDIFMAKSMAEVFGIDRSKDHEGASVDMDGLNASIDEVYEFLSTCGGFDVY